MGAEFWCRFTVGLLPYHATEVHGRRAYQLLAYHLQTMSPMDPMDGIEQLGLAAYRIH